MEVVLAFLSSDLCVLVESLESLVYEPLAGSITAFQETSAKTSDLRHFGVAGKVEKHSICSF